MSMLFRGKVVEGNKIGRTLGFPTINLAYDAELRGVYIAMITISGDDLLAVANLGERPTVGDLSVLAELHVLDWDGTVELGEELTVELKEKIREIVEFSSLDDLKEQISKDVEFAKNCYNRSDIFDDK